MNHWLVTFVLIAYFSQSWAADLSSDKEALKAFTGTIANGNVLKWNDTDCICNWEGVSCNLDGTVAISSMQSPVPPISGAAAK
ncbi:hypothetical protein L1887_23017 [Cichorium endivia]|nr:hypothetical protein L1887_23017 [Cichorium endivia]